MSSPHRYHSRPAAKKPRGDDKTTTVTTRVHPSPHHHRNTPEFSGSNTFGFAPSTQLKLVAATEQKRPQPESSEFYQEYKQQGSRPTTSITPRTTTHQHYQREGTAKARRDDKTTVTTGLDHSPRHHSTSPLLHSTPKQQSSRPTTTRGTATRGTATRGTAAKPRRDHKITSVTPGVDYSPRHLHHTSSSTPNTFDLSRPTNSTFDFPRSTLNNSDFLNSTHNTQPMKRVAATEQTGSSKRLNKPRPISQPATAELWREHQLQLESRLAAERTTTTKEKPVRGWVSISQTDARHYVPSKSRLVFDFDCTLTVEHMYNCLQTQEGQEELKRDEVAFYERMFGSKKRIEGLKEIFESLTSFGPSYSVKIDILSFGHEREIKRALDVTGLRPYFANIYGSDALFKAGITSPTNAKQEMLLRMASRMKHYHRRFVFVDDDPANFPVPTRVPETTLPTPPLSARDHKPNEFMDASFSKFLKNVQDVPKGLESTFASWGPSLKQFGNFGWFEEEETAPAPPQFEQFQPFKDHSSGMKLHVFLVENRAGLQREDLRKLSEFVRPGF